MKRPMLRRRVVLQHDSARPHTSALTKDKIAALGWEILPHPPYSPDLAPSDFYLFRSLQNSLSGKTFADDEQIRTRVHQFLASKPESFYRAGISRLPERWQKILDAGGDYVAELM